MGTLAVRGGRAGVVGGRYSPQLDGLRAFAVSAVLLSHFGLGPEWNWIVEGVAWGHHGVRLFFVLSGFLITRVLLRASDAVHSGAQSRLDALARFYARRSLRIFPVFYLTLAVLYLANYESVRSVIKYHLLYLSNLERALYVAEDQRWVLRDPASAHFWSLAVEEQFYLLWPLLVLSMRGAGLRVVIAAMCILAIGWRSYFQLRPPHLPSTHLPACLDTLGVGAVIALWRDEVGDSAECIIGTRRTIARIGCVLFAVLVLVGMTEKLTRVRSVLMDCAEAATFGLLVDWADRGIHGPVGRLLRSRLMSGLGKISYAAYVVHPFTPGLVGETTRWFGVAMPEDGFIRTGVLVTATWCVAIASWWLIEAPLLRLKDRIPQFPRPRRGASPSAE